MCEAMKSAIPEVLYRQLQQLLDTAAHLGRRLVGKGDGEKAVWGYALDIDKPGGTMHQHARLAAAGAGDNERGLGRRGHGLTLRVVQLVEDWRYIHEIGRRLPIAEIRERRSLAENYCSQRTPSMYWVRSYWMRMSLDAVSRYRPSAMRLKRGVIRNVPLTRPSADSWVFRPTRVL